MPPLKSASSFTGVYYLAMIKRQTNLELAKRECVPESEAEIAGFRSPLPLSEHKGW